MDRRQIATVLVLKELGIDLRLDSFNRRLIVQKSVYLAQASGLHLGYYYNWYLRGPYCSAVAQDLFSALDDPHAMESCCERYSLDGGSKARLAELRALSTQEGTAQEVLDPDDDALARRLELLASVHFLIDRRQVDNHGPQDIAKRLKAFNKDFTEAEVGEALAQLKSHGFLAAA